MSTFIRDYVERATLNRRRLLLGAAAGLGATTLPLALGKGAGVPAHTAATAASTAAAGKCQTTSVSGPDNSKKAVKRFPWASTAIPEL